MDNALLYVISSPNVHRHSCLIPASFLTSAYSSEIGQNVLFIEGTDTNSIIILNVKEFFKNFAFSSLFPKSEINEGNAAGNFNKYGSKATESQRTLLIQYSSSTIEQRVRFISDIYEEL